MGSMKIISETPINAYQLHDELKAIKKRDKELNFRAQKTEEHLNIVLKQKSAKELVEKLEKLNISRLKEDQLHKIVDIMPKTVKELKVVLQGYTLSISADNIKKIVDVLNKERS